MEPKKRGRQKGQTCKYTKGVAYVVAYRLGRNPDEIARFFKVSKSAVMQALKTNGEDVNKKIKKEMAKLDAVIFAATIKLKKMREKNRLVGVRG